MFVNIHFGDRIFGFIRKWLAVCRVVKSVQTANPWWNENSLQIRVRSHALFEWSRIHKAWRILNLSRKCNTIQTCWISIRGYVRDELWILSPKGFRDRIIYSYTNWETELFFWQKPFGDEFDVFGDMQIFFFCHQLNRKFL